MSSRCHMTINLYSVAQWAAREAPPPYWLSMMWMQMFSSLEGAWEHLEWRRAVPLRDDSMLLQKYSIKFWYKCFACPADFVQVWIRVYIFTINHDMGSRSLLLCLSGGGVGAAISDHHVTVMWPSCDLYVTFMFDVKLQTLKIQSRGAFSRDRLWYI